MIDMKTFLNSLKCALATSAFALIANPAQAALIINGTDVGQLDTVMGAIDSAQSGQAYEEAQLELACGCDVTLLTNVNSFTMVSDGTNNYIDVSPATPGYYLLKFGTGNTGNDMFFMENKDYLQYLAWSNAQLISWGLPADHVQSISHYAITSGGTTVPTPGTAALLGLGLLGLALPRLRKR